MPLTESEIALVEEKVEAAKSLLDDVCHISDGKDGNVIFLAIAKKKDLDIIVKCAKLRAKGVT